MNNIVKMIKVIEKMKVMKVIKIGNKNEGDKDGK